MYHSPLSPSSSASQPNAAKRPGPLTLHKEPTPAASDMPPPHQGSSHPPAPPFSIITEAFPIPFHPDHEDPNPGPIDPFDLTLWRPELDAPVIPRPRDGEFASFILDELGRLGNPDPTSYPSLLLRLRQDTNRAKSCTHAWLRASAVNYRQDYRSESLTTLIRFRNNIAILRSNSSYARRNIADSLSRILSLKSPVPASDHSILHAANDALGAIGEVIIEFEPLLNHLDTTITRSRNKYIGMVDESVWAEAPDAATIAWSDDGEEVTLEASKGSGLVTTRDTSPARIPGHKGVIDISDDEG